MTGEHVHVWRKVAVVEPGCDPGVECPNGIEVTTWSDTQYAYICGCRPKSIEYKVCKCGKVLF